MQKIFTFLKKHIPEILIILLFLFLWNYFFNIKHYPTLAKQQAYQKKLAETAKKTYLGHRYLIKKIEKSYEYQWDRFATELNLNEFKKMDLAWAMSRHYIVYSKDEKKLAFTEELLRQIDYILLKNKANISPKKYNQIQLSLKLSYKSLYLVQKKYKKAIKELESITLDFPYQDLPRFNTNLWSYAYGEIGTIYNTHLNNYPKAYEYYRKQAIDPRKLFPNRIGFLQNKDLAYHADRNYNQMINSIYYLTTRNKKHRNTQEILVEYLKHKEKASGFTDTADINYQRLKHQVREHGKLVNWEPTKLKKYNKRTKKFEIIGS